MSLHAKNIIKPHLKELSIFQRVLLITDGTVTELLEQYVEEPIKVVKLYEQISPITQLPALHQIMLESEKNDYLRREALLQGQTSLTNWLYAESTLLINNFEKDFRNDLLNSNEPIGKLWSKYRSETYKVIVDMRSESANILAKYFNIMPEDTMISRTYSVYSGHKVVMMITEKFPRQFFQN